MTIKADQKPTEIYTDFPKPLYQRYVQAAIVRSLASFLMWLSALTVYYFGIIHTNNFVSASIAVLYLILVNPPTLWVLKRIKNENLAEYFAYFISLLETIGFTAIIHSFGGIEATFLIPIYAAAIAYVGPMEPRKTPFIIAGFSSISFSLLLILEHLGILQTLKINPDY
jgi:hypothetical protein